VEFNKTAQASGVLAEVRLALLLPNQKQLMDLLTYTSDEVQARATGRAIHHMKYSRWVTHPLPNTMSWMRGSFSSSYFNVQVTVSLVISMLCYRYSLRTFVERDSYILP